MDEGLATIKTSAAERIAAVQQQLQRVDLSLKAPDTAFLIELIAGIFGFLGVGHMYAGLTNTGVVRLIAGFLYAGLVWTLFFVCTAVTLGIGGCLFFVPMILQVIPAYFSANELKQAMTAAKARGGSTATWAGNQPNNDMYLNQPADPFPGADIYQVPPQREAPVQPPRNPDQDQGSTF